MKFKGTYKLREIAGENLIVEQGTSQANMTKVISLNATALILWNELQGKDFTLEEVEQLLMNRFDISQETASKDAKNWADSLINAGIIVS